MAHKPKKQQSIAENWIRGLVGTPKRFLWTCLGLFILVAMSAPDLAGRALSNVVNAFVRAFAPAAEPLLAIAIAVGGIWLMVRMFRPKKH